MLAVGRITKLFGAEGEVNVNLYADFPDNFDWEEQPLFTHVDSLVVPLFCESFSRRGASNATVRFADIDTAKRAVLIMGGEVFVQEAQSDDEDEFTFDDLIGFSARIGRRRGEITDFYDNDANPLFEITLGGESYLVPAVEAFIAGIDFEQRIIKFVLPDGLLEL